jgi:hypothetical protein
MMTSFKSLSDEYSSQVRENEGLNKRNHYFNQINENCKQHRQWRKSPAGDGIHRSENEYQCNKAQNDDVTSDHVCKKTHDQCEGFCKNSKQFYWKHDEQSDNYGNTWVPENMSPKMFVGTEEYNKE